jgi:hypothetical protein
MTDTKLSRYEISSGFCQQAVLQHDYHATDPGGKARPQ